MGLGFGFRGVCGVYVSVYLEFGADISEDVGRSVDQARFEMAGFRSVSAVYIWSPVV